MYSTEETMNKDIKKDPHATLSDDIIIELYFGRSEQAIIETDKKYKNYLPFVVFKV